MIGFPFASPPVPLPIRGGSRVGLPHDRPGLRLASSARLMFGSQVAWPGRPDPEHAWLHPAQGAQYSARPTAADAPEQPPMGGFFVKRAWEIGPVTCCGR